MEATFEFSSQSEDEYFMLFTSSELMRSSKILLLASSSFVLIMEANETAKVRMNFVKQSEHLTLEALL